MVHDFELCENWCSENHSLLMMSCTSVSTFHIYCVLWVNCGVRCLNIMLLMFVSFVKIGTGKTELLDVNEITFMHLL
jgi:hypothetical protein